MSKKMLWDFAILVAVLYKIICLQFSYAIFCLFFSFMYSWVSLSHYFIMFYYSKLWECMLQKPLVRTACISGDRNQT